MKYRTHCNTGAVLASTGAVQLLLTRTRPVLSPNDADGTEELDDAGKDELLHIGQFMEDLGSMEPCDDVDDIPRTRQGIPMYMLSSFKI
jgi:hypothetical protein